MSEETQERTGRGKHRPSPAARRVGYAFAILALAIVYWIVGQLGDGIRLSFLTSEIRDVVPWIRLSLVVSMIVNVVLIAYDPRWFRGVTEAVTTAVGGVATFMLYQIYPFTFEGNGGAWDTWVRWGLLACVVIAGIGAIGQLARGIYLLVRDGLGLEDD